MTIGAAPRNSGTTRSFNARGRYPATWLRSVHLRRRQAAQAAGRRRRPEAEGGGEVFDGFGGPGRGSGPPVMENLTMAKANQKIAMNPSRNIPFDKLVLSQKNVRQVKDGVSIEQLADDIAQRRLVASLNVRPVLDDDGKETGMYRVPAGGRRFRALELLIKQKRLAKNEPIPCIVSSGDIGRRGLARRKPAAADASSARSVPRLQDAERSGSRRGGDRRPLLRLAGDGEAAAAARLGVAEAARSLRE